MKVFTILVLRKEPDCMVLAECHSLDTFGFFQKASAQTFLTFFGTTIIERTERGVRQRVDEDKYRIHTVTKLNGLGCCVITDDEYPERVAFVLVAKILGLFENTVTQEKWSSTKDKITFPELKTMMEEYQDPGAVDPLLKIEATLEETKEILHKNMQSFLERGEKIEDLVDKSEQLSGVSKKFFKAAKRTNACCPLQ